MGLGIISALRDKARSRLPALPSGFPERTASRSLAPARPDGPAHLVFVDGHFEPSLSAPPAGCIALPLQEAMPIYGLAVHNRLNAVLKTEADPYSLLNAAHLGQGLFLYVPPNLEVETPVHIVSLLSSKDLMVPRIQLFLGKSSRLQLIRSHTGSGTCADVLDVILEAGSQLSLAEESSICRDSHLFASIQVLLKQDASLQSFVYSEGSTRYRFNVLLAEAGASAELKGLSSLRSDRRAEINALVEHKAPHCRSRQHFKQALRDASRSHFEGKIYVHAEAQKTESYQLCQNLLLSPLAAATAKPNLEIFADDVKASHGATFSQLQEDELFYLRSRGLSEETAKELLFAGFCRELLDSIPHAAWKAALLARMA